MFEWWGKLKQQHHGRQIEKGKLPRGRTGESPSSGDTGNAIINGTTLLTVKHFRNGEEVQDSRREVWNRVVTNAGVDAIVDAFTNTFALNTFNYHDCGTGTTAEAASQTALVTPVTEARVAGAQSQPASNTYRSVATVTFSNAYAITEHGLFSQTGKPGGTLLDRTLFGAVNVISGDSISFTFDISFTSGG